ncbi:MAG TPA: pyridoxamine 5'-phosphate oxidase family protein [Baekduia sp.]|nr:pyridoxamine 5'-phosphate oxidase family protein [Baekduia sp.]
MSDRDPAETAREILGGNLYMTLGTADADGVPWVTPVYFTASADASAFYWVSSPAARHSQNLAVRPQVSIVVFDSKVLVGSASAVYMAGTAAQVDDADLDAASTLYGSRGHGGRFFAPEELTGDAVLRLYRATIAEHYILVRGSDPVYGRGVDGRLRVELSA